MKRYFVLFILLLLITTGCSIKDIGGRVSTTYDYDSLSSSSGPLGSPLANASISSVSTSTAGTLAVRTYYLKVTSIDKSGGQTEPSAETTCVLTGTADGCRVSISINSLAASTRLWIATTSRVYYAYKTATSSTLIATTTGLTAGTIPTQNTAYNDIGVARYNATAPTLTDTQLTNLQTDVDGALKVRQYYSKAYAIADTQVKAAPGFVHTVTFSPTDAAATGGTIILHDSLTEARGTSTIFYVPAAAMLPVTITLDEYFSTGIYLGFTTTADVNVNISYR